MSRLGLAVAWALVSGCAARRSAPPQGMPAAPRSESRVEHALAPPPDSSPALRLSDGARPLRATLELRLVPGEPRARGAIALELELTRATSLVWLHGRELEVLDASFTVGNQRIATRPVAGGEGFLGFAPAHPLSPGRATLRVSYDAHVGADFDQGLSSARDGDGEYVFSQFEPIAARRAFPCFDEPGFKIPWRVTLHVRRSDRAFANAALAAETDEADGMRRVEFRETRPLPSYLVAFAVGPFEVVEAGPAGARNTPLRIVVPRGRAAGARYAARIAPPIVAALEAYFGIPFPYEKLDLVAAPHAFETAMENAGLITFAQSLLLLPGAQETLGRRRDLALVCAHEVAHQWFGDLVTMAWWDDLWLNEAFSTWIEARIVERVDPSVGAFRAPLDDREQAFRSDALRAARRVRQPIASAGDIHAAFDAISYSKGAAVVAMFEAWIGEPRFRQAVRVHLAAHADGNATGADFVAALSAAAGRDAAGPMSDFLDQGGLPLVSLELRCAPGAASLHLSQRRYEPVGAATASTQRWRVPLCLRWASGQDEQRRCVRLDGDSADLALGAACPSFVHGAAGESRYYHIDYRGDLVRRLVAQRARLSVAERIGLISDLDAAAQAGVLPVPAVLAAWEPLAADPSPHVVAATIGLVRLVADRLLPDPPPPGFARWVTRLYGRRAAALGFRARPREDEATRLLRPELLALALDHGGDRALGARAYQLALRWLDRRRPGGGARSDGIDADLAPIVLRGAARRGDRAFYQRLLDAVGGTKDPAEREAILDSLGSFDDPAIVRDALGTITSDRFVGADGGHVLLSATARPRARDEGWRFLSEHVDAISPRLNQSVASSLPRFGDGFCDPRHRDEVEALFASRVDRLPGAAQALAETVERIDHCIALREAQGPGAVAFFDRR